MPSILKNIVRGYEFKPDSWSGQIDPEATGVGSDFEAFKASKKFIARHFDRMAYDRSDDVGQIAPIEKTLRILIDTV